MATKNKSTDTTAAESPVPATVRTPDNTPIPGGGRWAWGEVQTNWVSLDEPAAEPTTQADAESATPQE